MLFLVSIQFNKISRLLLGSSYYSTQLVLASSGIVTPSSLLTNIEVVAAVTNATATTDIMLSAAAGTAAVVLWES